MSFMKQCKLYEKDLSAKKFLEFKGKGIGLVDQINTKLKNTQQANAANNEQEQGQEDIEVKENSEAVEENQDQLISWSAQIENCRRQAAQLIFQKTLNFAIQYPGRRELLQEVLGRDLYTVASTFNYFQYVNDDTTLNRLLVNHQGQLYVSSPNNFKNSQY